MATERETLEIWLKLKGARAFAAETMRALGTMDRAKLVTKQVATETAKEGEEAEKASKKTKTLGQSFTEGKHKAGMFRQSLTIMRKSLVGLTAASSAFVAISFARSALDFEDAMARVKATQQGEAGFTPKMFKKLTDAAMYWGEKSKFSSTEVAQGLYELTTAGLTSSQALHALGGTTTLAAAAGVEMSTAAKIQAATINQFGLKAGQATDVADLLVQSVRSGAAEIDDLGESLKYIGPVAKVFGTNLHDTVTALTILGNAGIKGSQAGTSLRTMFVRLSRPTKMVKKGFEDLGVSQDQFFTKTGKLLPLPQLLDKLGAAMSKVGGKTGRRALSQITGTEALTAVLTLVEKRGKVWDQMSKRMSNAKGQAQKFSDTMMATTRGSIDQFVNAIQNVAVRLLVRFSPAIQSFFHTLQAGVNSLGDPTSTLRQIIDPFISILASLLRIVWKLGQAAIPALHIALVPVVLLFRGIAKIFKLVNRVLGPLKPLLSGIALGLIAVYGPAFLVRQMVLAIGFAWRILSAVFSMSPLGRIIFLVVTLGFALYQLYQHSETFRNAVNALWHAVTFAFDKVKGAIMTAFNWVKNHWPLLVGILTGPIGLAVVAIVQHFWDIINFIKSIPSKIASAVVTIGGAIKTGIINGMKGLANGIVKLITYPIRWIAKKIVSNWPDVWGMPGPPDFLKNLQTFGEGGIPGLEKGGILRSGGKVVVGESGPEILSLPLGSRVDPIPNARVVPLPPTPEVAPITLPRDWGGPDTIRTAVYLDKRQIAEAVHTYVKDRQARR